jgi:O-antigen/teichoic acid export membrane protein
MSEIRTLYRHLSHYFAGRVAVMMLGFVSFPVFTRAFSVADYGVINLIMKIVLMVTVFSKLGIHNSVLRFYEQHAVSPDRSALRKYYSTLFFGTLLAALGIALLFVAGAWCLPKPLISAPLRPLLGFAALLTFTSAMRSVLTGFFRAEGRTRLFNALEIAAKAGTIALVCALLFTWQRTSRAFFTGTGVVELSLVVGITLLLLHRHMLSPAQFDWTFFRSVLVFGFPLIGYEIANIVLDCGDRVLVQYYLGSESVGYYSAAYNLSAYVQELLMTPLSLALFPIYMKIWTTRGKQETQEFLSRSLDHFLILACGVVCVVSATARDGVILLASRKFQEAHRLVPLLVVGLVLYAVHVFLQAGLLIYKKTYTMTKLVFWACVLNVVLNALLLPRIGLVGAAVATLASYAVLIVMMARESLALLPFRIDFAAGARYVLAAAAGALLATQVQLGNPFQNVLAKGCLSVGLYAGILCLIDRQVRELAGTAVVRARAASRSGTAPISEIAAVKEN